MTQKLYIFLIKYILQLSLVLLALGAILSIWNDHSRFDRLRLSLQIESSSPGLAQVFYDSGNGINEVDSVRVFVPGAGQFKEINFDLPGNFINSLRIDPLDKPSKISIKELKLLSPANNTVMQLDVEQLKPAADIENLKIILEKGVPVIKFSTNSNDPQLYLRIESLSKSQSGLKFFEKFNYKKYFLILILILTISYLIRKKIFNVLGELVKIHPINSLFLFSILSVSLSSYPLFLGKSLNYAAGLPMLYEVLGWMPGYDFDGFFENFRGSDVAAHSWSFSPMSKVVHESIFKFFEFPLWNRFVGGGIPLWAQGVYMIGDPLHWITIFFESSSYAWDAKFYLSKFLFVFGLGLLIKKIVKEPVISFIIVLVAPFIGFYTYAFNHPSYFNLTYLPITLLAWIHLADVMQEAKSRIFSFACRILLVSWLTWFMLNAGATKESVITTALITSWGLIYNFIALSKIMPINKAIIGTLSLTFGLILLNSPYILLFLDALSNAATSYDASGNDPDIQPLLL